MDRPLHDVADQVVETALRAHRAVDEMGGEGAVAVAEVRLAEHRRQHDVRVGAVLDPQERVERDHARGDVLFHAASFTGRRSRAPLTYRGGRPGRAVRRARRSPASPGGPPVAPRSAPSAPSPVATRVWPNTVPGSASMPADSARARQIFSRPPWSVVHAPGRGLPGPHDPGELVGRLLAVEGELVDRELVGVGRLARLRDRPGAGDRREGRDQAARCPRSTSRARSSPAVSCAPIAHAERAYTGPVSSPASSAMMHTPVSASPASIARSTGAAPRHRGSNEKCRLTKPWGTASSKGLGQQLTERDHHAERRRRSRRPRRRPRPDSRA